MHKRMSRQSNEPSLSIPSDLVEEEKPLTSCVRHNLSWSKRIDPRRVINEEEMFLERPVSLLSTGIQDRFHIPDNIPILLIDDEVLSSVDLPNNMMYFTKEQFCSGHALSVESLIVGSFVCLHYQNELEGKVKGHVLVSGPWSGSSEEPDGVFSPQHSLEIPSKERQGRLVEWVDKASFTYLTSCLK
ncbi:hypothetical protein AAG906_015990 [Vitis piasezkii]